MKSTGTLLKQAIAAAEQAKRGRLFSLRSLFTEDEWAQIGPNTRMMLGSAFYHAVLCGDVEGVVANDAVDRDEVRMFIRYG